MAKTKPLTKAERAWLTELQDVMNRCPSDRLGFYTIGDRDVTIYDRSKEDQINDSMDKDDVTDFCTAVSENNAELGHINFPAAVHSTSG